MIRVLKQANFTLSNIGNVDIPMDDTQEAIDFVAKYSGISSAMETKAKRFINTLVNAGIYGKLTYLAVPMLATNVDEAIKNALLADGATQPTSASNMTFANSGLGFSEVGQWGVKNYRSQALTSGQFAIGVCVEYPSTWVNSNIAITRNSNALAKYARIAADYVNEGSAAQSVPGYYGQTSNNYKATFRLGSLHGTDNKGMQIVSVKSSGDGENFAYTLGENGVVTAISPSENEDVINNTFIGGSSTIVFAGKYKVFFESKCLNESEMTILRDALADLCGITIS